MILSEKLYQIMRKQNIIRPERIRRSMARLYRENTIQTEVRVDTYYVKLFDQVLWVLLLAGVISSLLWLSHFQKNTGPLQLVRDDYGGEEIPYTICYENEEQERQQFTITLEPVQYRPEELEKQFQEGFAYLEAEMLGDNESLESIRSDMDLRVSIPDSGLSVTWRNDNYEVMDEKGRVNNLRLTKDQIVMLYLELSYGERRESREYKVVIQPRQLTDREEEQQKLQQNIETLLQDAVYDKEVTIPSSIQGVHLMNESNQNSAPWLVFLWGIGLSGMLWLRQKEKLQTELKLQNQELIREYPYLVNQLVLYLAAGATVKGAFERILGQYEMEKRKKESLYEELMIMWNEMHSGVTQEQAYRNLGKRIGLQPYLKLTSLLTQQLQKGTAGVTLLLEQEERDAFERRKERAKRMGEEAGTKLLLPMIILMVVSMIIIVCPAIMSFTF